MIKYLTLTRLGSTGRKKQFSDIKLWGNKKDFPENVSCTAVTAMPLGPCPVGDAPSYLPGASVGEVALPAVFNKTCSAVAMAAALPGRSWLQHGLPPI